MDEEEYITVCKHFGVDENEAKKAFQKINVQEVSVVGGWGVHTVV